MKTFFVSLFLLAFMGLVTSCTVTETTYNPGYSASYVSYSTSPYVYYSSNPYIGYAGYGYDSNWYGGTPDYYGTSIYVSDW